MFDALRAGDYGAAMKVRRQVVEFEELRQRGVGGSNNVVAVKEAMRLLGMDSGLVRDPLTTLSGADSNLISGALAEWGLLETTRER